MGKTEIDLDALNFIKKLIFGSVKDPLEAASFRAYRDFNRTLSLGELDSTAREQLRKKVNEQLRTSFDDLILHTARSQEQYDEWHKKTCRIIRGIYLDSGIDFTFGQAQKWVNMTIKYLYVLGDRGFDDFLDFLHVPLDNYVLGIANHKFGIPRPKKRWSRWDDYTNEYMSYQLELRKHITGSSPFRWEFKAWNEAGGQ